MIDITIVYIATFYPSKQESYKGHFIEKQAKLVSELLNQQLIIFKPILSGRSLKKEITHENYNETDIYTIKHPNFFKQISLMSNVKKAYDLFKDNLSEILGEEKPTLIVSNDLGSSLILGNIMKKVYEVPHFNIIHGEDTSRFGQIKWMDNIVKKELFKCDKVLTVSNKTKKYFLNRFQYEGVIHVNGNGIEKNIIDKYLDTNINKNEVLTITTVGNIDYNKGMDIVFEAIKDLEIPYIYNVIGAGPYKKKLIKLIKQYNIEDNVNFLGDIDNQEVFKYLEKSHYFILPSRNEAFGIVYLEAMITRNICIGTKGQGCQDFIVDQKNGFLVSSADEITQIIKKYHTKDTRVKEILNEAQKTAENYTWEANAEKLVELYTDN